MTNTIILATVQNPHEALPASFAIPAAIILSLVYIACLVWDKQRRRPRYKRTPNK